MVLLRSLSRRKEEEEEEEGKREPNGTRPTRALVPSPLSSFHARIVPPLSSYTEHALIQNFAERGPKLYLKKCMFLDSRKILDSSIFYIKYVDETDYRQLSIRGRYLYYCIVH